MYSVEQKRDGYNNTVNHNGDWIHWKPGYAKQPVAKAIALSYYNTPSIDRCSVSVAR